MLSVCKSVLVVLSFDNVVNLWHCVFAMLSFGNIIIWQCGCLIMFLSLVLAFHRDSGHSRVFFSTLIESQLRTVFWNVFVKEINSAFKWINCSTQPQWRSVAASWRALLLDNLHALVVHVYCLADYFVELHCPIYEECPHLALPSIWACSHSSGTTLLVFAGINWVTEVGIFRLPYT